MSIDVTIVLEQIFSLSFLSIARSMGKNASNVEDRRESWSIVTFILLQATAGDSGEFISSTSGIPSDLVASKHLRIYIYQGERCFLKYDFTWM